MAERDTLASLRAKIAELSKPIEASDPRVEHIFAKAATLAIKADHCDEYDYITSEIGAPSREALAAKGLLEVPYDVHITFDVPVRVLVGSAEQAEQRVRDMSWGELFESVRLYVEPNRPSDVTIDYSERVEE